MFLSRLGDKSPANRQLNNCGLHSKLALIGENRNKFGCDVSAVVAKKPARKLTAAANNRRAQKFLLCLTSRRNAVYEPDGIGYGGGTLELFCVPGCGGGGR